VFFVEIVNLFMICDILETHVRAFPHSPLFHSPPYLLRVTSKQNKQSKQTSKTNKQSKTSKQGKSKQQKAKRQRNKATTK